VKSEKEIDDINQDFNKIKTKLLMIDCLSVFFDLNKAIFLIGGEVLKNAHIPYQTTSNKWF